MRARLANLPGRRYPWRSVKARAGVAPVSRLEATTMPDWIPVSRFGAVLAVLYAALAIFVVTVERAPGSGGGWISLSGMGSYLVTLPVSAPFDLLGQKLDYKRNLDMGFAVLACATLVYLAGAGLAWLVSQILQAGRS
jgi:hypothetical protein